jgi:hypothetical protein
MEAVPPAVRASARPADIAAHLRVAARRREHVAISAVVVDLPLVPVMAMKGEPGASLRRSRTNSSMSPMISTPAWRASSTHQCGLGWVSGTPGDRTRQAKPDQSASRRSTGRCPARRARAFPDCRPRPHDGAAGQQRLGRRHARPAEAEQGDRLPEGLVPGS